MVSPHLTPSNWPPSTCLTSSPSTCLAPTSFGAPSVPLPLVPLASAFAFPSILVFSCGTSPFFSRPLLVFEVLPSGFSPVRHFLVSLPCGPCVCASLPSGPSSPPPGPGFYRFLLILEVIFFRHFLLDPASTRHFLLALRHLILASRSARRFHVSFRAPFLVSFRSTPGRVSPHFIDLALPPSPVLALRLFQVFRFSSHEATAQPHHRLLYFRNVHIRGSEFVFIAWKRLSPPQSARRFRRQLSDWPPTRVVELSHENPTKLYFLTALSGNPSPPPSTQIALVALCSGRLPLHSDISRDHL